MADKVVYKLKGHEKFLLREGWLNKGIKAASVNPRIFLESNGPDVLGVGSNMVKSIRYWMQASKLLVKEKNKEDISDLAQTIMKKDPYFEDYFTLWVIHSNLVKNRDIATVWYIFFNNFQFEEFSKTDLYNQINVELFKFVGKKVTESSVKDDIDVLLNMYTKNNVKNDDPEDKNICPLSALGLIRRENDNYIKVQPDIRKINDSVIMHELSCMFENEKSLSIERISTGEKSLGAIYHLSRVTVNKYLDNLETIGFIKVDRTAGLDIIYPVNMKSPKEVINEYYK